MAIAHDGEIQTMKCDSNAWLTFCICRSGVDFFTIFFAAVESGVRHSQQ
jgi:hypothetical protein